MKTIIIAVIDNYPVIRESLAFSFRNMGFEVALTSDYNDTVLANLTKLQISACCLNVTSSEAIVVAHQIKAAVPTMKIIGYALDNTSNTFSLAIDLFLSKSETSRNIRRSINKLCLTNVESG